MRTSWQAVAGAALKRQAGSADRLAPAGFVRQPHAKGALACCAVGSPTGTPRFVAPVVTPFQCTDDGCKLAAQGPERSHNAPHMAADKDPTGEQADEPRLSRRRLSTAELLALLRQPERAGLRFTTFLRSPKMSILVDLLLRLARVRNARLVVGASDAPQLNDPLARVVGVGNPGQIVSRLMDAASIAGVHLAVEAYSIAGKTVLVAEVGEGTDVSDSPLEAPPSERRYRILAVATEWLSRHGGLSTFNRELCAALQSAGCDVTCLIPEADEADFADAAAAGVMLVVAPPTPGADERARLMRPPPVDDEPHIVIGHGRVTGPAALSLCADLFPSAHRIHFVHTVAEEIEWFKHRSLGPTSTLAARRDFTEKELSSTASLVIGVGPLLRRKAATMLRGVRDAPDVLGLLPGITKKPVPDGIPEDRQVLILGRTEDRYLKGLDIAARALGSLDYGLLDDGLRPTLVVRGAPPLEAEELQTYLVELTDHRISVLVRDYTADRELLEADLLRSSLLLMPSRNEGFGLVALEAIGAGVPVLVSDTSGVGEHLIREGHARFVVPTRGPEPAITAGWSRAIDRTLFDLDAAFVRAADLRDVLAAEMAWDRAADDVLTAVRGLHRRVT